MKKLIFLLIGILITLLTFSQEYYPFPDTNAIWNSQYGGYYGTPKLRFGLRGDTTINSQVYNKVYQIVDDSTLNLVNLTYYAAIRENTSKQIFVKISDYDDEILIYDFSLNVGDTIVSNSPSGYLNYYPCILTGIDSIELENNQFRKRFKINEYTFAQDYWIEGIGSMGGLFNPIMEYIIGSYCELKCFKHNDTALYINNPDCNKCFCTLLTPVIENEESNIFIKIFPNPAKSNINIDFKLAKGLSTVRLLNSYGKIIESRNTDSFPIQMNIDYLHNGIYLIQIDTEYKIFNNKFIKKE